MAVRSPFGITTDRSQGADFSKCFFFYPILTRLIDSFSCSPFNTFKKSFKKFPDMLRCDIT